MCRAVSSLTLFWAVQCGLRVSLIFSFSQRAQNWDLFILLVAPCPFGAAPPSLKGSSLQIRWSLCFTACSEMFTASAPEAVWRVLLTCLNKSETSLVGGVALVIPLWCKPLLELGCYSHPSRTKGLLVLLTAGDDCWWWNGMACAPVL